MGQGIMHLSPTPPCPHTTTFTSQGCHWLMDRLFFFPLPQASGLRALPRATLMAPSLSSTLARRNAGRPQTKCPSPQWGVADSPITGTQGLTNKTRMAGPDAVQPSELGAGVRVKGLPEQISVVLVVSPWKPTALPLGARSHHGHQGNR